MLYRRNSLEQTTWSEQGICLIYSQMQTPCWAGPVMFGHAHEMDHDLAQVLIFLLPSTNMCFSHLLRSPFWENEVGSTGPPNPLLALRIGLQGRAPAPAASTQPRAQLQPHTSHLPVVQLQQPSNTGVQPGWVVAEPQRPQPSIQSCTRSAFLKDEDFFFFILLFLKGWVLSLQGTHWSAHLSSVFQETI